MLNKSTNALAEDDGHFLGITIKPKNYMKNTLKIISVVSLVLFGILWVLSKFINSTQFIAIWEFRDVLILIYLFMGLKYYQMEVKDKNAEIKSLKIKLREKPYQSSEN